MALQDPSKLTYEDYRLIPKGDRRFSK